MNLLTTKMNISNDRQTFGPSNFFFDLVSILFITDGKFHDHYLDSFMNTKWWLSQNLLSNLSVSFTGIGFVAAINNAIDNTYIQGFQRSLSTYTVDHQWCHKERPHGNNPKDLYSLWVDLSGKRGFERPLRSYFFPRGVSLGHHWQSIGYLYLLISLQKIQSTLFQLF